MAVISYIQRRRSGVYEFRKRLPQMLAGKPVPANMRDKFPSLVNTGAGRFKREFVQSLDTKETAAAKKQALRIALRLGIIVDEAVAALASPSSSAPTPQPSGIAPHEIGEAVYRQLLADDEAERLMGDDRRRTTLAEYDRELGKEIGIERAARWPDLEPLQPASGLGMQIDHSIVYDEETGDLAKEYRAAYARRDPSIVFAETAIELKKRGAVFERDLVL
jgi:hypothetical protein